MICSGTDLPGAAASRRGRRARALAAAMLCLPVGAPAQDLSLFAGSISSLNGWPKSVDRIEARFDWHRIVTDSDRDTDVVARGAGYRF